MKELLYRTLTGALIIIITVTAIAANEISLFVFIEIIFFLGISELSKMVSFNRDLRYVLTVMSGAMLIALSLLLINGFQVLAWLSIPLGIFLFVLIISYFTNRSGFKGELYFFLPAIFWLALPLSLFLALGRLEYKIEYNFELPLAVIVLIWINDTFAYLTGSMLGKHKMTPRLSPNKTWEGFLGGMIITVVAGWITWRITDSFNIKFWIIISLTTVLFGFLGDLTESSLKRTFNVKNSGSLLPGHGGILDRFDSLLIAAPAVFLVILISMLAG